MTTQTSTGVSGGGSALAPVEHIDTRDNVADPDVIGWFGLEYDGPRCAGDDCRTPVDEDGLMCEPCEDSPHEFRHDGSRFDFCVCGRIRAALVHHDDDEGPEQ